jgi:mRNA interferase RelE/StbE
MRARQRYRVEVTRSAEHDLDKLPLQARSQVLHDALTLEKNPVPRPPLVKRLRGYRPPLYRLRSGDYRLLFRIADDLVYLLRVINRRDLDRTLRHLGQ